MVGSTTLTPLGSIKAIVGSGKNITQEVTIRSKDVGKFLDEVEQKVTKDEAMMLKSAIIEGIIDELKSLPPSKHYWSSKYMKSTDGATKGSLRQQIIDGIERDNKVTEPFAIINNKASIKIRINHPLAYALNFGTGIHNKDNPHLIKPKEKRYMFIPGDKYMSSYYARKAVKMGLNTYGQWMSGR